MCSRNFHLKFWELIDLVFYNCILKCHLLIDLKIGELTHQDVGQMDGYVRMFDEKFRFPYYKEQRYQESSLLHIKEQISLLQGNQL